MNLKKYSPLSFDVFIHIFCVKVVFMHKTVTAVTRTMLDTVKHHIKDLNLDNQHSP